MIGYDEAVAIIEQVEPLSTEYVATLQACGFVAAENVVSEVYVPSFANSAMDGFAVRYSDLAGASEVVPVVLSLKGSTVAGDVPSAENAGGAWEIMTGAAVPEGYDAVVKVEDVQVENGEVRFFAETEKNANIRFAGEDFAVGDVVVDKGDVITPMHVMGLAAIGVSEIAVKRKPKVTVLTTGKEVVDDWDAELLAGQIRNSNSPYLMSALQAMEIPAVYGGIFHDEPEVFEAKLETLIGKSDIIISTGAVSAGKHDFIPDSLRKLGAEIVFHKVAIRPGKPVLYARFPDGTHYFGLPGNPVSAAVGLRFFVVPLLRKMQGQKREVPLKAFVQEDGVKKQGLRFFRKSYAAVKEGKLEVQILQGQESFKISPLVKANCWAVFAEEESGYAKGTCVDVYPLHVDQWQLSA